MTNGVIGTFVDSGTSVILMNPLNFQYLVAAFQANCCFLLGVCGPNAPLFNASNGCITVEEMSYHLHEFPDVIFEVQVRGGGFRRYVIVETHSFILAGHAGRNKCVAASIA